MDRIATMSVRDCDDTTLTAIGRELSEMMSMCISELDELLDSILDRLLSSSDYLVEGVSPQVSDISARLEE
jgi:hypothetical protein